MAAEYESMPQLKAPDSNRSGPETPQLTRREAMLQLLRVGGIAAGAAGAGIWLSDRSHRPVAASAEQARKDHRVSSDQQWPHLTVAQYAIDGHDALSGEPRALVQKALENLGGMRPVHRAAGRRRHQAQHRLGSHAGAGRKHQS